MTDRGYNRTLHWLAIATTAATFPLIWMGGLVTSHGAGMSVPDWPNSYGYNMFLFPPSQWVGGIFYEHTHRLLGTLVGLFATLFFLNAWGWGAHPRARRQLLAIGGGFLAATVATALVVATRKLHLPELFGFAAFVLIGSALCRRPEPRRWVRWVATALLVGVIFQGVLGGLRVVMVDLDLAIVHACFAQAFFCFAAFAAVVTSRWWHAAPTPRAAPEAAAGRRLAGLAVLGVVTIYAQLIVGAIQRHYRAGLAIPDLPLAYGKLLPPTTSDGLAAANRARAWDYHLDPVTLEQIWWHFGHRVGAIVVTAVLLGLIGYALAKPALRARFTGGAALLLALLATQVTLGLYVVILRKPADVASLHVATGAVLLLTTFVTAVRAARLYRASPAAAVAGGSSTTTRPALEPAMA